MFQDSIRSRRCIILVARFYEWDSGKNKITLYGKNTDILFLAGIYQEGAEGGRFAIITEPADETVAPIHDRMPVRIPENLIEDWLSDTNKAKEILDTAQIPVVRKQEVEQMRLWE